MCMTARGYAVCVDGSSKKTLTAWNALCLSTLARFSTPLSRLSTLQLPRGCLRLELVAALHELPLSLVVVSDTPSVLHDSPPPPCAQVFVEEGPRVYECGGTLGATRARVQALVTAYNDEHPAAALTLTLFADAVRHVMRIARVLAQPRGSALLVRAPVVLLLF